VAIPDDIQRENDREVYYALLEELHRHEGEWLTSRNLSLAMWGLSGLMKSMVDLTQEHLDDMYLIGMVDWAQGDFGVWRITQSGERELFRYQVQADIDQILLSGEA
jgi:hypothetical protein